MKGGIASPDERAAAEKVCTPLELETWRIRDRGLSQRSMALALGVSVSTIRTRLFNADRKIAIALTADPDPEAEPAGAVQET